jgi:protein PhnA
MWSEFNPVKVVAWRILQKIRSEGWARDLQEQLYLEEEVQQWAESGTLDSDNSDSTLAKTKDSNGNILLNGDAVTLIKDLQVKGAGFTAKRGTLVKNITLTDNPSQIEGKVNGTQIVLLTQFLKKVTD